MKHNFHFVLNSKLKKSIIKISKKFNISISSTINYIIKLVYPVLEKYYYFFEEDSRGNYEYIDADSDVHVYMDIITYRKIRRIYNDMYIFSMAMLLRWMLENFIAGIKKYGFERFIKIIQRYGNIHKVMIYRIKKWKKKEKNKHMLHYLAFKEKYRMTFSENYTLLGIELLN